jgi:formate dehydrogenase subunit gamma
MDVSCEADEILRFRASERHLHWAIAVPFKVCYVTALILVVVYNPHPHRPLRDVVSWVHRLSGVCLAVLPPLAIARHWRDWRLHWQNVREAWTWSREDVKWLVLMVPAALTSRVSLPRQGKFNAAEKINFMVLTSTYPWYVVTGITIWFLGIPYISWLLHFGLAVTATPLLLGHVFMATVNPDTRVGLTGMITGMVSREWARHHYTRWYEAHHSATEREPPPAPVVFLPRAQPPSTPSPGAPEAPPAQGEAAVSPRVSPSFAS